MAQRIEVLEIKSMFLLPNLNLRKSHKNCCCVHAAHALAVPVGQETPPCFVCARVKGQSSKCGSLLLLLSCCYPIATLFLPCFAVMGMTLSLGGHVHRHQFRGQPSLPASITSSVTGISATLNLRCSVEWFQAACPGQCRTESRVCLLLVPRLGMKEVTAV